MGGMFMAIHMFRRTHCGFGQAGAGEVPLPPRCVYHQHRAQSRFSIGRKSRLLLPLMFSILVAGAVAGPVDFSRALPDPFKVIPLPGHPSFVFTLYGVPSDLGPLKELVGVMRREGLGNGFDPGPTPAPNTKPVFDYLAGIGWPVVCYPGCGDMQIKGGRCVMGPANAGALESMDRAGVFSAVQLGEWGYYFHNLSHNEPWWRDVYGREFETFKHLMKPPGLSGYDRRPATKQECHDVVKDYFTSRSRDLLGRVISVTGHSHYEAYAGEWGARCIGLEVGENIAYTQSKFAFARGASRQWQKPWSVQVSPWFSGACTTSGPLRSEGGGARGLDAGHSLSLYERMWLHGWFAGANDEFYANSQLDNLASCHAAMTALLTNESATSPATQLCAFFDHEEVGSESHKGAAGSFLPDILQRIAFATQTNAEDFARAMAHSFLISADMAHAYQPSFPLAYDADHKAIVNQGPVIKVNANQRYSTESPTEALFINWCQEAGVPYQKYSHRCDLPCGSTIGPITSAKLGVRSLDIGNPMWAMHSLRESAGVFDHQYLIRVLQHFFKAT